VPYQSCQIIGEMEEREKGARQRFALDVRAPDGKMMVYMGSTPTSQLCLADRYLSIGFITPSFRFSIHLPSFSVGSSLFCINLCLPSPILPVNFSLSLSGSGISLLLLIRTPGRLRGTRLVLAWC
jgi:hypothetical protein